MYNNCNKFDDLILLSLLYLQFIICFYVVINLNNMFHVESMFIIMFAIYYIYLHFIDLK